MNSEFECNNLKIGMPAPNFEAETTQGKITLNDYKGKWLVFFSHPGDFTPVCTTEFIAFSKMYDEFKKINAELLGLSVDSTPSHLAWLNNIRQNTNIVVPFPVIADRDGAIAKKYSMMSQDDFSTGTVRSVYIICPQGKIKVILNYPKEIGRNMQEILRILYALQTSAKNNVMLPANWVPGMPWVVPQPQTFDKLNNNLNNSNFNCIDWYLCFNGGNLNE